MGRRTLQEEFLSGMRGRQASQPLSFVKRFYASGRVGEARVALWLPTTGVGMSNYRLGKNRLASHWPTSAACQYECYYHD